jgi:hypothetical protein
VTATAPTTTRTSVSRLRWPSKGLRPMGAVSPGVRGLPTGTARPEVTVPMGGPYDPPP